MPDGKECLTGNDVLMGSVVLTDKGGGLHIAALFLRVSRWARVHDKEVFGAGSGCISLQDPVILRCQHCVCSGNLVS